MCPLIRETTRWGSTLADSLAVLPTITLSPSKSTTDGVIRSLSWLGTITGFPCSSTYAIAEYVVPRSIPYTRFRPSPSDTSGLPLLMTEAGQAIETIPPWGRTRHASGGLVGNFVSPDYLLWDPRDVSDTGRLPGPWKSRDPAP